MNGKQVVFLKWDMSAADMHEPPNTLPLLKS